MPGNRTELVTVEVGSRGTVADADFAKFQLTLDVSCKDMVNLVWGITLFNSIH